MIGSLILHYKIIEKLGEGGMGVVYKAVDTNLNRIVALKFLPHHISIDSSEVDRFKVEARAAAALNNVNITTIYSIEKSEEPDGSSMVFLVMEFIDGIELKEKIKKNDIPFEEALDISIKICEGIEAAHKGGVIHRDIKSSNIMVTANGAVKIMDFGLAKSGAGENLTRLGTTLGTISYMSPEQTAGENIDHQTDIWSLGVVMYEMFTGQLPFKGDYDQAIVYSILNENPRELSLYNESIPAPVQSIILKALAKDKKERYQSASELLKDLKLLKQSSDNSKMGVSGQYSFVNNNVKSKRNPFLKSLYFKLIIILISVSVIGFLLFNYLSQFKRTSTGELSSLPEEKHIAVLPFEAIGKSSDDQTVAEGLSEIITSKLSQLQQYKDKLWIVPTSEILKSKVQNPEDAFKNFGVNLVISGSIQKFKDKRQLIINLINPSEKRQIGSKVIDEPVTGLSSIQDEAVIQTAKMLNLDLEEDIKIALRTGETDNPVANNLYIQARGKLLHFDNIDNVKSSIELFKKAIDEDSAYALAYAGLGEACLRMFTRSKDVSWVDKAKENCNKALGINQNFAEVHITLGLLYTQTGKYEDANKEFLKAEDIDPTNVDAYQGQATAYNKEGKVDEAESIYKKVIKMRPNYWAGYIHLGVFYYLQGKYKEAARQFEEVIKLTPQNAVAYRNLGAMYYYLDQKADAIVMFKHSLEIEPDYSVYSNLATLYYYEGLYSDAASMYEKALEMQSSDYSVWGYLAGAYRQNSADSSRIVYALRKAKFLAEQQLKINPVDPQILINVASYCTELNLPDSAKSITNKVVSLNPKDVNVMILVGEVYEQLGMRDKAISWVIKSIENGYSIEELNHIPELKNLRNDDHFKNLILSIKNNGGSK